MKEPNETKGPNLFNYATKELSQDAFFAWLLDWANPKYAPANPKLHECGRAFLDMLMSNADGWKVLAPLESIKVELQKNRLDVVAKINKKYLLFIEDKTGGSHHHEQLKTNIDRAMKMAQSENLLVVPVYVKTYNENRENRDTVQKHRYKFIGRRELLDLFQKYTVLNSEIFESYLEWLQTIDEEHHFEHLSIGEFKARSLSWVGFYSKLEENEIGLKWHWVHNESKGFWNHLLTWNHDHKFPTYIQIEEDRIAFKVMVVSEPNLSRAENSHKRRLIRNALSHLILKESETFILNLNRPHYGNGQYMTLAEIKASEWLGNPEEKLKFEIVRSRLEDLIGWWHGINERILFEQEQLFRE